MILFIIISIIIIFLIYYFYNENETFKDIPESQPADFDDILELQPESDNMSLLSDASSIKEIDDEERNEIFNDEFFNFKNRVNNSSTGVDDPVEKINRTRFTLDKNIGATISDVYDELTSNNFKSN